MSEIHQSSEPVTSSVDATYIGDRRNERVTLADPIVSAGLWGVGASWMAGMLGTMTLLQQFLHPRRIEPVSRLYCRGQLVLTGSRWRAIVHPEVDPDAVYVFAQNHTNHFDHVAMYNATPHFKQGLELASHFDIPVYGWFMKSRGTIAVPNEKEGRTDKIREGVRREIRQGHSILAFPEGTRTLSGRVGPFRTGIFYVARDLGIPIVPVAVTGMYDVMRKGSWLIRPGHTVTVHVERPIPTAGRSDGEIDEIAAHAQRVVAGHVDEYFQRTRDGQETSR